MNQEDNENIFENYLAGGMQTMQDPPLEEQPTATQTGQPPVPSTTTAAGTQATGQTMTKDGSKPPQGIHTPGTPPGQGGSQPPVQGQQG